MITYLHSGRSLKMIQSAAAEEGQSTERGRVNNSQAEGAERINATSIRFAMKYDFNHFKW